MSLSSFVTCVLFWPHQKPQLYSKERNLAFRSKQGFKLLRSDPTGAHKTKSTFQKLPSARPPVLSIYVL